MPRFKRVEGMARPVRFELTGGGLSGSGVGVGSLGSKCKRGKVTRVFTGSLRPM